MPLGRGDTTLATRMAFMVWDTVPELLNRAFLVPPTEDYTTFLKAEREKQDNNPDLRKASAAFRRYVQLLRPVAASCRSALTGLTFPGEIVRIRATLLPRRPRSHV